MSILLDDKGMVEVLHHTPITTMKFDSKLTLQDKRAFTDEMKIELRAITKAQAKKIYEWGNEKCFAKSHHGCEWTLRHACSFCWQALYEEIK